MQAGKGYRKDIHLIWSDRLTGFFFILLSLKIKNTCFTHVFFTVTSSLPR